MPYLSPRTAKKYSSPSAAGEDKYEDPELSKMSLKELRKYIEEQEGKNLESLTGKFRSLADMYGREGTKGKKGRTLADGIGQGMSVVEAAEFSSPSYEPVEIEMIEAKSPSGPQQGMSPLGMSSVRMLPLETEADKYLPPSSVQTGDEEIDDRIKKAIESKGMDKDKLLELYHDILPAGESLANKVIAELQKLWK